VIGASPFTVVVMVALLFVRFGSGIAELTVIVFVIKVPGGVAAPTFTMKANVTAVRAGSVPEKVVPAV
jgi:hypothetical protein